MTRCTWGDIDSEDFSSSSESEEEGGEGGNGKARAELPLDRGGSDLEDDEEWEYYTDDQEG